MTRIRQKPEPLCWDALDEQRVALALAIARDGLSDKATGNDIVMAVIKGVVDIDRRTQVGGYRLGLPRSSWVKHDHADLTAKDRHEILEFRKSEIANGETPEVVLGFRIAASIQEQEIMAAVLKVFRSCLVGKEQIRDWKLLWAFASVNANGHSRSIRDVGRKFKVSRTTADDRRKLQLGVIWNQVARLMPAPLALAA